MKYHDYNESGCNDERVCYAQWMCDERMCYRPHAGRGQVTYANLSLYACGMNDRMPVTQSGMDQALVPPTPEVSLA